MTFDYKKYSLENLEKWIEDAINSSEASPQEIYDVIKRVVEENYYCYKNNTERCYELLALLNGNGKGHIKAYDKLTCDKDDKSPECQKAWNDFWEENYYPEEAKDDGMRPWGHSDLEYGIANDFLTKDRISNFPGDQYTEEELNAMCDKAASDEEKDKCREYNLREAEYATKNVFVSEDGDIYPTRDKVVKWRLPVEVVRDEDTGKDEYCVTFPDDLLEAANLKEGDTIEWVDQGDGSFMLRKVSKPLRMDEC